jgi:hypothetical protein
MKKLSAIYNAVKNFIKRLEFKVNKIHPEISTKIGINLVIVPSMVKANVQLHKFDVVVTYHRLNKEA